MSLIAFAITSCSGGKMEPTIKTALPSIKEIPAEDWQKLSQKKIFFGHQSVGYNIIDGIKDVMKENPQIKLNIIETSNPSDYTAPLLGHSPVGNNMDPKSKRDAFVNVMDKGLGNKVDIAFFKFCYVDIFPNTDVNRFFSEYRSTMLTLQTKYPQTVFIHITAPLTTVEPGLRAFIRRLMGHTEDYKTNVQREQFNQAIRNSYAGKDPVFDLADIESTSDNGTKETFEINGKVYPRMVPAYTTDGGHLNETGRKLIAEQLLIFLSKL
jgi:hypothetical protein